ncbi:hypothetical protein [Aliarcobacter cryaerophilus]|uniref:Uncharacterized protein n=1 Tax=Aliarcobacter cryaerophilus TaxID=28198 RepID=A0A2S9TPV2_9BACT|nr:hypothetical protein [Aliarcobacter cryaerophilus]PRN00860.1 hypothetical protein CJ668_04495 [Arcobacter cryaerophilus gv. pseudocryaerophilus]
MISPIQTGKTYGVLHTESFFSFLGFAKKIGSDEIQKIDVFLDNKLIDTIEANEFIQKIDDMYDVESKAFKYNLPSEYIGKKAIISFKNHDSGEELLNSPYTLIDKNHEKFNEAKFLHSLSEPINEEIKNMYKPNCIGFLANDINLNDPSFMNFIYSLKLQLPSVEFIGFKYNSLNQINDNINTKYISSIVELLSKSSIFISNRYEGYHHYTLKLEQALVQSNYVNPIIFDSRLISMNLESFENLIKSSKYDPICDDYLKLGLKQNYNNSPITTIYKDILHIDTSKLNFKEIYVANYYEEIIKGILCSEDIRFIFNKMWKLYVKNIFN